MTTTLDQFDPKDPGEIVPLTFEFKALTDAPESPVILVTRFSGSADATPAAILAGAPQIVGTQVRQKVTGGLDGTVYKLVCEVSAPNGFKYRLRGKLPIEAL